MNRVVSARKYQKKQSVFLGMFVLLLGLHATASVTGAQGTTAFTFQGNLEYEGSPANGNFDFQFILFDGPDPFIATQIGPAVNVIDVVVEGGLFFVVLDFGPGIFNGDMRFLQILVRKSGVIAAPTPLFPLHKLNPVPYATFAVNSNELDGLDSTDFLRRTAGCEICIGHADNNGSSPERQQCFDLGSNGRNNSNFLAFPSDVDENDRLWAWIQCP